MNYGKQLNSFSKIQIRMLSRCYEDAKIMYEHGRFKNTLNRAYYAIFYAIRAVNATQSFDSSKHSGVIAFFNQHYVKTGIFPKEASKIIKEASENRERADYLDFFIASKKDAEIQLAKAERFQALVTEYFKNKEIY